MIILKIIAMITMVIDHIGFVFLNNNLLARTIGRIAFPLFIYGFSVGCLKTANPKKRALRILITAIITEPIYDYLMYGVFFAPQNQNVLFPFALAAFAITFMDGEGKTVLDKIFIIILTSVIAMILKFDASIYGMLSIYICYFIVKSKKPIALTALAWIPMILMCVKMPILMIGYIFPTILICFAEKIKSIDKLHISNKAIKYTLRYFYSVHLILLLLVKIAIK